MKKSITRYVFMDLMTQKLRGQKNTLIIKKPNLRVEKNAIKTYP